VILANSEYTVEGGEYKDACDEDEEDDDDDTDKADEDAR
jgi:hypothetical protein